MQKWILASAIILASSCATFQPVPVVINCPPELLLPTLNEYHAADLQKLENETYEILVTRDMLLQQRVITLCSIIESTHQ